MLRAGTASVKPCYLVTQSERGTGTEKALGLFSRAFQSQSQQAGEP